MLELAYWIGPTPGVTESNPTYNIYRDGNQLHDRYVMMHLHVIEASEMLRNIAGRTYLGVAQHQVYHASDIRWQVGGGWRVEGRDFGGFNSRDGWECPGTPGESLWYIGSPRDLTGLDQDNTIFWTSLQRWAEDLFRAGYVGGPAQTLLFRGSATLVNGDINPANPGQLVRAGDREGSSQLGGQDPYRISFTVPNHRQQNGMWTWEYNLAPRAPPP